MQEFPHLQNRYNALQIEDESSQEVDNLDHSSFHLPQQILKSSFSSQKIYQHSTQFAKSFPTLVVRQPPLKMAENHQILVAFANLDSSDKLKGKLPLVYKII